MSLISTGAMHRKMADRGFAKLAQLSTAEERAERQAEAAQRQAEMQNLSMGGGMGAMYGLRKGWETAPKGPLVTSLGSTTGGLDPSGYRSVTELISSGGGAAEALEGGATISEALSSSAGGLDAAGFSTVNTPTTALGSYTGGLDAAGFSTVNTPTAIAEAGAAATAETGAAGAVEAVAGEAVAAEVASAGAAEAGLGAELLGGLSAMAGPIAIGLGVAFLLNKLFD